MSVIAVKNFGDKIVIAADSQITRGDAKSKHSKLFYNEKNNLLWGASGYCREISTFEIFLHTRLVTLTSEDEIYSMFLDFINFKKDFVGEKTLLENSYLMVSGDKAFYSSQDGWIIGINSGEFEAIGCGFPEAKTALHLGHSVEEAIEITCKVNAYCMEPVIAFEMKNEKVKRIQ